MVPKFHYLAPIQHKYLTSQMCSICEEKLFFVGIHSIEEQNKTTTMCRMQKKKTPMYGVLKCPYCVALGLVALGLGSFPYQHSLEHRGKFIDLCDNLRDKACTFFGFCRR
jgi:hypothetical protein